MEAAVLEKIIEQQYRELLQQALRILKQPYDAEDAVQNSCLKAWSRFPYTAVNACEAWLHVIVYHECIMILRNRSRYGVLYDTEKICFLCDTEDHIDVCFEKQSINEMVESLPIQYASLIKLRYYEGLNVREIANQLHESAGTIRSRLFRARKIIHDRYCEANRILA